MISNNTYTDPRGVRYCRTCERVRSRKRFEYKGLPSTGHRTHCPQGHAYVEENTRTYRGSRYCRLCHKMRERIRRDLKQRLDHNYTFQDERLTKLVFSDLCFNCNSSNLLEIDHHYPLSHGFGLSVSNAVLLCRSCNASKNNRLPEDFYTADQIYVVNYLLGLVSV